MALYTNVFIIIIIIIIVNSPSRVWGEVPAEIELGAF